MLVFGGAVYYRFSSDYEIIDNEKGFVLQTERLNKTVVKELNLKKGDVVEVIHEAENGSWDISIEKVDEEPVFFGNTYDEFERFSVEIQEAGTYQITCKGKNAKGNIKFIVK